MKMHDVPLLHALSPAPLSRLASCRFDNQGRQLSQLAWAFATLAVEDCPLLAAISSAALSQMQTYQPQSLSNLAWSVAKLKFLYLPLMDCIAPGAVGKMDEFNCQELSNTAWAFATCAVRHESLLAAISSTAIAKIFEFKAQSLTTTAWSFATLSIRDVPLMAAISAGSMPILPKFSYQDLSSTAWSFATVSFRDVPLMQAIAPASVMREFRMQSLANTAWAFATLAIRHAPLMKAIAANARRNISSGACEVGEHLDNIVPSLALSLNELDMLDEETEGVLRKFLLDMGSKEEQEACRLLPVVLDVAPRLPEPSVLKECGGLYVFLKPADWVLDVDKHMEQFRQVDPARSMRAWLAREFGDGSGIVYDNRKSCGFAHRLDKQTSGALLWASNYQVFYFTRMEFACRRIRKEYACLTTGVVPQEGCRFIRFPLKEADERDRLTRCVPWGKFASTEVMSVGHLVTPEGVLASLVKVKIHTGRKHQIRAHLAEIGHPLLGDAIYGGPCPSWGPRVCLHAEQISVSTLEGLLAVRVPLLDDLKVTFECLAVVDRLARAGCRASLEG